MKKVTDPNLLAQLEGGAPQGLRKVEDPALLAELEGPSQEEQGLSQAFARAGVSADNPQRYSVLFNEPDKKGVVGSFVSGLGQGALLEHGAGTLQAISEGLRKLGFNDAADAVWSQDDAYAREGMRAEFKQATQDHPVAAGSGEFVGQVAPAVAVPGGVAGGAVKRGITGAIAGGATGALQYVDPGEFRADNALFGAAVGGAAGVAMPSVIKVAKKVFARLSGKPSIQVFDDTGQITDEAMQELQAAYKAGNATPEAIDDAVSKGLVDEGVLTPEQASRFNLFKRYGLEPNRANITQATDDWMAVQEGLKRGGQVADNVASQDARMIELAREGVEKIGPLTEDVASTNANIYGVVQNMAAKVDDQVNKAYAAAREKAGQIVGRPTGNSAYMLREPTQNVVQVSGLLDNVRRATGDDKLSGGVVSAVRGELKNRGLWGPNAGRISVDQAENIRQVMNEMWDSATPRGRRMIARFKNALDDDVAKAVGEDVFADARKAKQNFERIFTRQQANKFDRSTGKLLEQILDGTLPENRIMSKVLSEATDNRDLLKIKSFLTEDAGAEGAQAWLNLKAQVLRDAMDKAVGTQAKREGGQAAFNARLFKNQVDKLKRTGRFDLLFNSQERAFIDDLIELGNLRVPVSSVATGKGPSAVAIDEAQKSIRREIIKRIPFVGEGADAIINAVQGAKDDVRQVAPTRQTEEFLRNR